MPAENDYRNLVSILKHLKPVLDDVANHKAPHDEDFSKECEELDIAVNEAREFLEKWSPRMSKILCVLQSKPLVLKIQISAVKLSHILCRRSESSPTTSNLCNAQSCVQESQSLKVGQLSEHLEEILKCQKDGKIPGAQHLMEIIESFNLRSSQELLSEYIALEKEKQKAEDSEIKEDLDQISQTVALMSHIREYAVKLEKFNSPSGIQIPSYFRCPLSLELMLDPVIVASGQTYERAAIQKWLDHGLVRCPKTGYMLSHKNLITNYTVKALITNWCNENEVELPNNHDNANTEKGQRHSEHISHEDDLQCPLPKGNSSFETQNEKFYQSSPEHSYVHSRSESASSAVSSIDYVPSISDGSGDIKSAGPTFSPNKISGASPSLSGKNYNSSKTMVVNGNYNSPSMLSLPSESGYDELTSTSHVEKLVNSLKSVSTEIQTEAAGELRFLAKHNMENRVIIDVELTQEHAVTALLNLSINDNIKSRIAEEGALEPLIHVLRTGNAGAKENAAAAIFSISLLDEYRIKIGRSGAVKALVDLLRTGTVRGKKDAATALFNLSIFHENKARIVQAGAVKYLVGFLDPATEMVDKAVALLANLSTITEGCSAIAREGAIPLLVEIVETGSQRGKENAASILLQLCINSTKYCRSVLQEGAVPPLVALSQSGTPRAKEKAQQLLSHFRNQRETVRVPWQGGDHERR
ncbi:hypothetical protein DH2020_001306 [Rehmannia glutinosa]|uniref:RING-type E3 ubiquitin transferase n=1 Tax=Rehmannia glutinosa TaxID=99300 RepID=A0ABR0XYY6_REHGL